MAGALERTQWGRVKKVTDEGGGSGGPQALTRAIFNWCETGSVAEGARWGPGGPAPFLDLLKTWGWGPPASPSSQTDTPVTASEAAPPGEGQAQAQAQSTPVSLVSPPPLGSISLNLSDPLCGARVWALGPVTVLSRGLSTLRPVSPRHSRTLRFQFEVLLPLLVSL